jgi:hypothetical protein
MPGTIVLLLPVLSLAASSAAENPRWKPPPFDSGAVEGRVNDAGDIETGETRRKTSDAPVVPPPPKFTRIPYPYELPDAPIEQQVAVAEVLKLCFVIGALAIMAFFGCWKLLELRKGRRKRLLKQTASAGRTGSPSMRVVDEERPVGEPSPRNIEAASKWLTGLAQHTDQIKDPGKAEPETRDAPG